MFPHFRIKDFLLMLQPFKPLNASEHFVPHLMLLREEFDLHALKFCDNDLFRGIGPDLDTQHPCEFPWQS
jgi:hypothetical protein